MVKLDYFSILIEYSFHYTITSGACFCHILILICFKVYCVPKKEKISHVWHLNDSSSTITGSLPQGCIGNMFDTS